MLVTTVSPVSVSSVVVSCPLRSFPASVQLSFGLGLPPLEEQEKFAEVSARYGPCSSEDIQRSCGAAGATFYLNL